MTDGCLFTSARSVCQFPVCARTSFGRRARPGCFPEISHRMPVRVTRPLHPYTADTKPSRFPRGRSSIVAHSRHLSEGAVPLPHWKKKYGKSRSPQFLHLWSSRARRGSTVVRSLVKKKKGRRKNKRDTEACSSVACPRTTRVLWSGLRGKNKKEVHPSYTVKKIRKRKRPVGSPGNRSR